VFQFEKMYQNNQYSIWLDPFGFHTRVTDRSVTGMNLYEKIKKKTKWCFHVYSRWY